MGEDKRITALGILVRAAFDDWIPIVDVSDLSMADTGTTKRITPTYLFASPQAIGSDNANTGTFTILELMYGTSINEFSIDGTFADDSDMAVPTEKAVKTYVDATVLAGSYIISQDDSYVQVVDDGTTTGYVEIVTDGVQVAYFDAESSSIRIGKASGSGKFTISDTTISAFISSAQILNLQADNQSLGISGGELISLDQTANTIIFLSGAIAKLTVDSSGITLENGTSINEFSIDETLAGDSDDAIPTEKAVKTYIDTQIISIDRSKIYEGYTSVECFDTTSETTVIIKTEGVERSRIDSDGLKLESGVSVNEISTNITLADDSTSSLVTEYAIKTYVDSGDAATLVSANAYTDIEIAALDHSKIYEGYSSVECFDTISLDTVVIKTEGLVEAPGDTTTEIFYYTGYSTSDWNDPGNMVDGNIATYASAETNMALFYQVNNTNNVPSTRTETITKVEVRGYTYHSSLGQNGAVRPKFSGGDGSWAVANPQVPFTTPSWSNWVDVTDDTNAPVTWTWVDVNSMDAEIRAQCREPGDIVFFSKIEIRVTYQGTILVPGSVERARFDSDGFKLENGTSINEFSIDGTLAGNSDDAVPTEKAVKTYVDVTVLAGSYIISQGNSYVQVIDDGTAAGYVEIVTDGVQVGYYDAQATSQRLGKATGGFSFVSQDAAAYVQDAAAAKLLNLTSTLQQIGIAGDSIIILDQTADQITITAGNETQILVETTGVSIYKDLIVTGDLFVDGTAWVVHNQEVTTSDNLIVMNYGEVGPGVTSGFAGFEVDRGTLTNYQFLFYENTDTFRIGEIGNLQAVSTREDAPISNNVSWWNTTEYRFDTAGDTFINIDQTASSIAITANSVQAVTIGENGITLQSGATINEFSIDGTLLGNSDTAIPTEKAVKSYADGIGTSTLSSAESYADGVGTSTLTAANTYTDTKINSLVNIKYVYLDTTAMTGDVLLVDTTAGNVNIELIESFDGTIVIKRITTGGDVIVFTSPGLIDGQASITLDTPYQSLTVVSDNMNFFIL